MRKDRNCGMQIPMVQMGVPPMMVPPVAPTSYSTPQTSPYVTTYNNVEQQINNLEQQVTMLENRVSKLESKAGNYTNKYSDSNYYML